MLCTVASAGAPATASSSPLQCNPGMTVSIWAGRIMQTGGCAPASGAIDKQGVESAAAVHRVEMHTLGFLCPELPRLHVCGSRLHRLPASELIKCCLYHIRTGP